MKKFISFILIYLIFGLSAVTAVFPQDYKWEPLSPIKGVFADISVGGNGFGLGAGFRYSFIGLNLGLTGITNTSPTYAHQLPVGVVINRNQPLPNGYVEESFLSAMFNADAVFYLDLLENFSFNAQVGYYAKNDSVLAKNVATGSKYIYTTRAESGICLGAGIEYVLQENINIGASFHSVRGVLFRFTYLWF